MAFAGKGKQRRVLILVENLPSPFDRRVWQEATTLHANGYEVSIICPTGKGYEGRYEELDGIHIYRYKLPLEMREPVLQRIDTAAQPVMQLSLSSTAQSHAEISRLAEDVLAEKFRGIDGVATVNVDGALRRELSVLLKAEKLREYNVSITDVVNALDRQLDDGRKRQDAVGDDDDYGLHGSAVRLVGHASH